MPTAGDAARRSPTSNEAVHRPSECDSASRRWSGWASDTCDEGRRRGPFARAPRPARRSGSCCGCGPSIDPASLENDARGERARAGTRGARRRPSSVVLVLRRRPRRCAPAARASCASSALLAPSNWTADARRAAHGRHLGRHDVRRSRPRARASWSQNGSRPARPARASRTLERLVGRARTPRRWTRLLSYSRWNASALSNSTRSVRALRTRLLHDRGARWTPPHGYRPIRRWAQPDVFPLGEAVGVCGPRRQEDPCSGLGASDALEVARPLHVAHVRSVEDGLLACGRSGAGASTTSSPKAWRARVLPSSSSMASRRLERHLGQVGGGVDVALEGRARDRARARCRRARRPAGPRRPGRGSRRPRGCGTRPAARPSPEPTTRKPAVRLSQLQARPGGGEGAGAVALVGVRVGRQEPERELARVRPAGPPRKPAEGRRRRHGRARERPRRPGRLALRPSRPQRLA